MPVNKPKLTPKGEKDMSKYEDYMAGRCDKHGTPIDKGAENNAKEAASEVPNTAEAPVQDESGPTEEVAEESEAQAEEDK